MHEQTSQEHATSLWSLPRDTRRILAALGAVLGAAAIGLYAADGYGRLMLALWLGAIFAFVVLFEAGTRRLPRLTSLDVLIPLGLVVVFAPLYLVHSYSWPVQVNSDEVVFLSVSDRWSGEDAVDPFGLSGYYTVPLLPFWVLGELGDVLGGVDLASMRLLHGLIGLAAIAASYGFFRQLLPRTWAAFATCVLGVNHALFMLSRMALYQATALLVEMVALSLLVQGLRRGAPAPTFLGGLAAGIGFYVYYPARMVIILWAVFMLALVLRRATRLRTMLRHAAVALTGFALLLGPVLIADAKAPPGSVDYQRTSWLLYPEGRELAKEWAGGTSVWDGVKQNVLYGLSAFNNTVEDHSWMYVNTGHGFLDPLTGVLLWVGVAVVLWQRVRGRGSSRALLPLISFVTIWVTLSFVVNKAPSYQRLLIGLPFVAYFAAVAVRFLSLQVKRRLRRRSPVWAGRAAAALAVTLLMGISAWNVAIASDFIDSGRSVGHDIGTTGRYVQSRRDEPGVRFYIASSERWPFYVWALPSMVKDRLRMFSHEGQVQDVVRPERLAQFTARPRFALLMSRPLWLRFEHALAVRYPHGRIRDLLPDGSRVVFEVPPART